MNLILLNSVQKPTMSRKNVFKRFDTKILTKHIKQVEQRKMDNLKESVSFFKEMATQDIKLFQTMHDSILKEFQEVDITTIVPVQQPEDDVFDN